MKRWLYAYDTVAGDPTVLARALRHDIGVLLRAVAGVDGDEPPAVDGSFELRLPSPTGAVPGGKRVRATAGVAARSSDGRTRVPLRWRATAMPHAFPTFDGMLELQPLSDRLAQLSLVGSYDVPLGPVGLVADATLLAGAAQRTAQDLVAALGHEVAAAARAPAGHAPPAAPDPARPLTVRDVMTPHVLLLDEAMPLRTAALLLFHYEVSGAPVVATDGSLVGVLSERDLLDKEAAPRFGLGHEASESERRRSARSVGDACSRPARTTAPAAALHDVARALADLGIGRLVVVDHSEVAGVVSRHDVLAALVRTDAELQAAVDATLADLEEADVVATVEWGTVVVKGEVALRSRVGPVIAALEALDGVQGVDSDVTWRTDDVLPPTGVGLTMGG